MRHPQSVDSESYEEKRGSETSPPYSIVLSAGGEFGETIEAREIYVHGQEDNEYLDHTVLQVPGNPLLVDREGNKLELDKYLEKEFHTEQLNRIHKHLWWAGRPNNIRQLHYQKIMLREIIVTEQINLHLVWFDTTIYVKPLPACLLNNNFFQTIICPNSRLRKSVNGFLRSYTKLIKTPLDFKIAESLGLLPQGLTWDDWHRIYPELIANITPEDVDKRYIFGELRLGRLNHIQRFVNFNMWGYYTVYRQYDEYFTKNFGWLLLLVVYISVILSALQVVSETDKLPQNFENLPYGFAVGSLLLVVIAVGVQGLLWVFLWIYHVLRTVKNLERTKTEWVLSWIPWRPWMPKQDDKKPNEPNEDMGGGEGEGSGRDRGSTQKSKNRKNKQYARTNSTMYRPSRHELMDAHHNIPIHFAARDGEVEMAEPQRQSIKSEMSEPRRQIRKPGGVDSGFAETQKHKEIQEVQKDTGGQESRSKYAGTAQKEGEVTEVNITVSALQQPGGYGKNEHDGRITKDVSSKPKLGREGSWSGFFHNPDQVEIDLEGGIVRSRTPVI